MTISRLIRTSCILTAFIAVAVQCGQKDSKDRRDETILKGEAAILVDESLFPIVEDLAAVFESEYDAKLKLIQKSEAEVVNALVDNQSQIAILSRKLTNEELSSIQKRKIYPITTRFATDAIAFITNKSSNDTLIRINDIVNFIKGKPASGINGIVLDNPNSGTARELMILAGISELPDSGVYSFKSNKEAIAYVANNRGMLGVVGLNWLSQPSQDIQSELENIKVVKIMHTDGAYYSPSQNNLAESKYPLARHLYVVNCQGYQGLGMGFASFVAGERGQRIILKSGLLPVAIPGRKIITRSGITKESK